MRKICHIVDDTSPGGVSRFLDFMSRASVLGVHEIIPVQAGLSKPPRLDADVVVSHVVLSWKNLPFFTALRATNIGKPIIHIEHSYSPAFEQLHVTSPRRFHAMLGVSFSLFDKVVAICGAQRDWLVESTATSQEKVELIPPCVDISAFRALPTVKDKIRSLGAFGRFDSQKGFDILIPAFIKAKQKDMTLNFFGDGPLRSELEALANGYSNIIFHGFTDTPAAAMKSVDAVAMPSRREPYGLVALEALAAGRALLVSRVDGLIHHAQNGAIPVERLTVPDWANAIRCLDQTTSTQQRNQAKQLAARSEDRFLERWSDLLNSISH